METNYEESYRRIMEYQNQEHLRNQKKIRWGIRCVILIPLIFLMLMFSMDSSKVVFLVLWIVSLFTISGYLIYVEYMDYTLQERLTELGIKEDGKIDTLLPNSSIDSRLAEMERKIAADRAILAKYFGDSEVMPDEALLEEKEDEVEEDSSSEETSEDTASEQKNKKKEKKKDKKKDKED
jgi:hypothetical protein